MSTHIQSRTASAAHLIGAAKRQCRNFIHVFAALFAILAAMVTITASTAEAATIRWTAAGAFDDGGTANGYFDYDTVSQSVLGWNFTLAGGAFPDVTLASTDPGASGVVNFFSASFASSVSGVLGMFDFSATLLVQLSDPVNVIPVLLQQCYPNCGITRIGSGELTGEALAETPLPAALPLFATVIGLGAVLARRRKQQTAI